MTEEVEPKEPSVSDTPKPENKLAMASVDDVKTVFAAMKTRIDELEQVVHGLVGKAVGHGTGEEHNRLYHWYEAVKARLGL